MFDGNASMKKRLYRTISVPRNAPAQVLLVGSLLTLFMPSNFRGINRLGPNNVQCWGRKMGAPTKLIGEKRKTVVFITFKFCLNVAKCLFLML